MNYIDALQRRYSVKKFDSSKNIPETVLKNILEAGKLSASSLGMQPYEILVIHTREMLEKLVPAFYNPSQVSTCSALLVIVSKKKITAGYIQNYFSHISDTREISKEKLDPFRKSIDQHISGLSQNEIEIWADKQGYIVLGNLIFAAAMEGVDTCPMEGFNQQKIDEILGLDPQNEKVNVTLALGYGAEDDHFRLNKKVRKPDERLFRFL